MTIQSQLNNQAISKLSKISNQIKYTEFHERNQIINYTLRAINNSRIAIDEMTAEQLEIFQNDLMNVFSHKNWI